MSQPDSVRASMSTASPPSSFAKPCPAPPRPPRPFVLPPDEPVLPDTENRLRCSNRRRLFHAFRMPSESRWVADWLFSHPAHPFHHHTTIPPASFHNSLAIHATQNVTTPTSANACLAPSPPNASVPTCASSSVPTPAPIPAPISVPTPTLPPSGENTTPIDAGHDLLLVPVARSGGRLIGYTFGGIGAHAAMDCAFDPRHTPFFPHFVGRFAFDGACNDLLVVVNRLNSSALGVMSIQRGDAHVRMRSIFAIAAGSYGFRRLPARIWHMGAFDERRLASVPKYQFGVMVPAAAAEAATGEVSLSSGHRQVRSEQQQGTQKSMSRRGSVHTDMATLTLDLAGLERLVKGRFLARHMRRDIMDSDTGELSERVGAQVESAFDVMDAIRLQVFRDMAIRAYYSYMASVQGATGVGAGAGAGMGQR